MSPALASELGKWRAVRQVLTWVLGKHELIGHDIHTPVG